MDAVLTTFVNSMLKAFDDAGQSFVESIRQESTGNPVSALGLSLMGQAVKAFGNSDFNYIPGYDVFWHTAVFRNDIEYHSDDEEKILSAYRDW